MGLKRFSPQYSFYVCFYYYFVLFSVMVHKVRLVFTSSLTVRCDMAQGRFKVFRHGPSPQNGHRTQLYTGVDIPPSFTLWWNHRDQAYFLYLLCFVRRQKLNCEIKCITSARREILHFDPSLKALYDHLSFGQISLFNPEKIHTFGSDNGVTLPGRRPRWWYIEAVRCPPPLGRTEEYRVLHLGTMWFQKLPENREYWQPNAFGIHSGFSVCIYLHSL